ncbi:MAG: chemotaxis protein CheB [Campylobacterota bacterium]
MDSKNFIVVGVGSSAGGLEALQVLLTNTTDMKKYAFIIAQHLSPTHKSMMVDLLARTTNIPVVEAKNDTTIKPNTIYITPENKDVYVSKSKIFLTNIEQTLGPKPSVNYFFNSLAQTYKKRCVGVILSGTGSDGAFGIRSIKDNGGITIAQAPSTAKYDGMPISAINTGKVDLVVPIENMGLELERISNSIDINVSDQEDKSLQNQLFSILYEKKSVDFSQYKKSTVLRRIERRLATLKITTLSDYVQFLKIDDSEYENLYSDILIGVTEFFRDKEVFEDIKDKVKQILEQKESHKEIRFWCIGCSTGEEAYSLAIVVLEILKERIDEYKIKIFATDIDEDALAIARSGVYAETSLVGVNSEYKKKYFNIHQNQYHVKKSLRELVIFSKHNIISDAPFLKMDFISCRNMLIYFNQTLQDRFFPIVHYALNKNATLLLGKSESIGNNMDLFVPLDKKNKIFKAQYTGIKKAPRLYTNDLTYKNYDKPIKKEIKKEEDILQESLSNAMMEYVFKECVIINSSDEIIYIKGKNPFLQHSEGKVSNNIYKTIHDTLSLELRSVLGEVKKTKTIKATPTIVVRVLDSIEKYVQITVVPQQIKQSSEFVYALFFHTQAEILYSTSQDLQKSTSDDKLVSNLRQELSRTKNHLQSVIEELETSYEEMQSLNEELSSSNEELQSSNEELETTNEELQSTNEELQTAYSELKILYDDKENKSNKLEELTQKLQSHQDIMTKQKELTETIVQTVPIGIVSIDEDGKVILINKNIQNLFECDANVENIDNSTHERIKNSMPFELIQKTLEPIYKVDQVLLKSNGSKVMIKVSGVPLLDKDGRFLAAVFSITQKYSSEILIENSDIKTQNDDFELYEEYDVVALAMVDISKSLKSYMSDLSLLTNSLTITSNSPKQIQNIQKDIDTTIDEVNQIINSNINFYTELFTSQKANLITLASRFIKILRPIFNQQNITLNEYLEHNSSIVCSPRSFSTFFVDFMLKIYEKSRKLVSNKELKINFFIENRTEQLVFELIGIECSQELFSKMQKRYFNKDCQVQLRVK